MIAFRWFLGLAVVVFGGWFLFFTIIIRPLFGRSKREPWFIWFPAVALALLLAALIFSSCKPLLHAAAAAAAGLAAFSIWRIRDDRKGLLIALVFLAAWAVYYWLAAWRAVVPQ